jgi:hypothetical protein
MIVNKKDDDLKKKKEAEAKKKKEAEAKKKKEAEAKKKVKSSETAEMGNTTLDGELEDIALPKDIVDNDITDPKQELPTSDKLDSFIGTLQDEGDVDDNVKDDQGDDMFGATPGEGSNIVRMNRKVNQEHTGRIKSKEGESKYGVKWDDNSESVEDSSELEKLSASCQIAVLQHLKDTTFRLIPFFNKKDNVFYTKGSYLIKSNMARVTRLINRENFGIILKNSKIVSKDKSAIDTTIKSNRFAYRVFSGNNYIFLLKGKIVKNSAAGKFEWFKKIGSKYISESGKSFATVVMQKIGKPEHLYVNVLEGKFMKSSVKYGFKSLFRNIEQGITKIDSGKELSLIRSQQEEIASLKRKNDILVKQNVLLSRNMDAKEKVTSGLKKSLLESRNNKFVSEEVPEIKSSNVEYLSQSMRRI